MPTAAPPAPARASTGLVLIDGADGMTQALEPLIRGLGTRVVSGVDAADAIDLAVRSGERTAIPSLVILTGDSAARPARWATWRALGVPHVPVEFGVDTVCVGPVVVPGTACLRCVALHRHDVRRLDAHRGLPPLTAPPAAPDPTLTALGAGVTALITRNVLLHRRHLPGVGVELTLADPHVLPRRWEPHPRCDGHGPGATMAP